MIGGPAPSSQSHDPLGAGRSLGATRPGLDYAGYSRQFVETRQMLLRQQHSQILRRYDGIEEKLVASCEGKADCVASAVGFLGAVERGTVTLDVGDLPAAVDSFTRAERFLQLAENESKFTEWAKRGLSFFLESVSGYEEIGPYYGEGFERVLMLNYKTIAYMLQGDRSAYNVTRRAIDWQNIERIEFERKVRAAKEKLEAEKERSTAVSKVAEIFADTEARAASVPSAYVNPFGYYMAGVIQELEARVDPSLLFNAAISYRKALALNPTSPVIQAAVADVERGPGARSDGKLLHVIVNDGFAPEKMVVTHMVPAGRGAVPLKLPYYRPVANAVERIVVETPAGVRLGELSKVADVEAIALRHQKDLQPLLTLRFAIATVRTALAAGLTQHENIFAKIAGQILMHVAAPDTRSWMSLPAGIQAARLRVPQDLDAVVITTYGADGRKLVSATAPLSRKGASFVYGRSINDTLLVRASEELWVNAVGRTVASKS